MINYEILKGRTIENVESKYNGDIITIYFTDGTSLKIEEEVDSDSSFTMEFINTKFHVGQDVKYYKSYEGYVKVKIKEITGNKIITDDGMEFDLNGVKRFDAIKEYKLEII